MLHHTATPSKQMGIQVRVTSAALRHPAMRYNTLQHTVTRCNTLQHAATRCNTLQHAATRCNTTYINRPSISRNISGNARLLHYFALGGILDVYMLGICREKATFVRVLFGPDPLPDLCAIAEMCPKRHVGMKKDL